jgi:microcystin degradation protein MlrC
MARIAIGGFQHETNTFAPSKATFEDFARGGAWPGLTRGPALIEAVAGINLPITQATPSAEVTEEAYERIAGQILEDLAGLRHCDAVYLDLHGAMVAEHLEDGEGELLARVRRVIGPEPPLVASLDLHANVTAAMVELSDALAVFRTYPHIDMAETGARAAELIEGMMSSGRKPHKAYRQLPFLIPTTAGCTTQEPAKGLFAHLESLDRPPLVSLSFACGFGPADIHDCGPSVVAYGEDATATEAAAQELYDLALAREDAFAARFWQPAEAVAHAMAAARTATHTATPGHRGSGHGPAL